VIEVHLPAQHFQATGLREGDRVLATPRNVRLFVQPA
jgi:hypothetical protein